MSSLFDSLVYQRRKHTPWARIALLPFVHELCYNDQRYEHGKKLEEPRPGHVTITITYRHSVSSWHWYEMEWIDDEGEVCRTSSQEFDLMLWRAAQHVIDAEEKERFKAAKDRNQELKGHQMLAPGGAKVEILSYCYDPGFSRNLACVGFLDGEQQGQTAYFPFDDLKEEPK